MKQKKKILWMLLPVLVFGGCGSQGSVLKRTQEESSLLETQEKEPGTADGAETKDGQEENPEQTEESLPEWIYVDVCGNKGRRKDNGEFIGSKPEAGYFRC